MALGLGDRKTMLFSNLVHLKVLLMVLTAAVGTVAGGTMLSSYVNGGKAGPSFLLTVNPSTVFIEQGTTLTSTASIISVNGFSGAVSLSLFFTGSRLPATVNPASVSVPANGTAKSTVTGSQNPLTLSCDGTASSTLDITTSLSTTLGNYNITLTGTDGSWTHSTVISLTVVDPIIPPPVIESLKLNRYQFINGTSLSLVLLNAGNTSVTVQSYTVQDSSGNTWTLSNLAGPTIIPNDVATMSILIGANCPGCVYGGIPGLFFQFNVGQSYTVILTT